MINIWNTIVIDCRRTKHYFFIETKVTKSEGKTLPQKEKNKKIPQKNKNVDASKYQMYFDYKIRSVDIKPHQVIT